MNNPIPKPQKFTTNCEQCGFEGDVGLAIPLQQLPNFVRGFVVCHKHDSPEPFRIAEADGTIVWRIPLSIEELAARPVGDTTFHKHWEEPNGTGDDPEPV